MSKQKIIIPDLDRVRANRYAARDALTAVRQISSEESAMLGQKTITLPYIRCGLKEIIEHCDALLEEEKPCQET